MSLNLESLVREIRSYLPTVHARIQPGALHYDGLVWASLEDRLLKIEWTDEDGYRLYDVTAPGPFATYRSWRDAADDAVRFLAPRKSTSREELHALVAQLLVFTRAAEVRIHARDQDTPHVEVAHPKPLHRMPLGLFEDMHRILFRHAGFSYSLGDFSTREFWDRSAALTTERITSPDSPSRPLSLAS